MSQQPLLVIVGGLLGAGKTTLILAAARLLEAQGIRTAVILNDQGGSLVDTEMARSNGLHAGEVTAGCFCCRFSELVSVAESFGSYAPEVIFAEPVGSCTDLSATVLQPLQADFHQRFRIAPLTILVDPGRDVVPDSDVAFLLQNQIAEADLVCFTKSDRYPHPPFQTPQTRQISAATGAGVAEWLTEIMSGSLTLRNVVLDIDYERYAQAEAALAWLNAEVELELKDALSPALVIGPLLDDLDRELTAASIPILHLKALDRAPTGYVKASICANGEDPAVQGDLSASPSRSHRMLLNLRAVSPPEIVEAITKSTLERLPGQPAILTLSCFSPAAPRPEHRVERPQGISNGHRNQGVDHAGR